MLDVRHLNAFYGDAHVLHDIAFCVGPNEKVAILGRNGAGKSTLLKSVMNAGPRSIGELRWNGSALTSEPPFRRALAGLSMVPEDRRIFRHLTVLENLELFRSTAKGERYAIEEVLDWFPILKPLLARRGDQLSGGQQQALAVARGVIAKPKLLLLDEPTEGLAPIVVEHLAESINVITAQGVALLLSEQNVYFARSCVDRIYVLDSGSIVFAASWQEFDENPEIKVRHLAV